jgi:hypothetical protein
MKFLATNKITRTLRATPDKGADQLVWLATSTPDTDWSPGSFYVKRKPKVAREDTLENAPALWEQSELPLLRQ